MILLQMEILHPWMPDWPYLGTFLHCWEEYGFFAFLSCSGICESIYIFTYFLALVVPHTGTKDDHGNLFSVFTWKVTGSETDPWLHMHIHTHIHIYIYMHTIMQAYPSQVNTWHVYIYIYTYIIYIHTVYIYTHNIYLYMQYIYIAYICRDPHKHIDVYVHIYIHTYNSNLRLRSIGNVLRPEVPRATPARNSSRGHLPGRSETDVCWRRDVSESVVWTCKNTFKSGDRTRF